MQPQPSPSTRIRLAAGLLAALATLGLAPAARAALTCTELPGFTRLFLRGHVRYNELTPELRERAIDNFVVGLDRSRTLLTEAEAQQLRAIDPQDGH